MHSSSVNEEEDEDQVDIVSIVSTRPETPLNTAPTPASLLKPSKKRKLARQEDIEMTPYMPP